MFRKPSFVVGTVRLTKSVGNIREVISLLECCYYFWSGGSFYKSSESSDYLIVDIVAWVLPPERSSRITLTGVLATSRYTSANLEVKRSSKWKSFHFTFEYVA